MADQTQNRKPELPDDDIAAAYGKHYDLLAYVVVQRFHVPDDDVQGVIHDVFVAFIRNRARIRDERTWLMGATYIQCRLYWRARGRDELFDSLENDAELAATVDDLVNRVEVSAILRQLPQRCRELLQLRYFEQYSAEEIARRFATTVDYARKLVHRCVVNARALVVPTRGRP